MIYFKRKAELGLTGYSDLRDIERLAEEGNKDCLFALAMNAYRIKKFIGSYTAAMGGLDAIVFTAGVEKTLLILEIWYVRIWNSSD